MTYTELPRPQRVGSGSDLPKATQAFLKDLARRSRAQEACGFILDNGAIIEIKNVAANTKESFEMSARQQLNAMKRYSGGVGVPSIIGVFHTHPSGSTHPSQRDVDGWPYGLKYRYFIVTKTAIAEWSKDPIDISNVAIRKDGYRRTRILAGKAAPGSKRG